MPPQSVPSLLHNLSYLILTAHQGNGCMIIPASPDGEEDLVYGLCVGFQN